MMQTIPLFELAAASDKMLCALDQQALEVTATELAKLQQKIFAYCAESSVQNLTVEEKVCLRKAHFSLDEIAEHLKRRRDEVGAQIQVLRTGKKMRCCYSL